MAAYIWKSESSVLHHNGRFYRNGDNIPAGILTDDRIAQLVKIGKIVKAGAIAPAEPISEVVNDSDKKSKKNKSAKNDGIFDNADNADGENELV